MPGLIAIVGRPNVGKSALFNRIVGKRIAIVHDQPGVTRDRVSAEAEWQGRPFTLVDTGGLGLLKGEKTTEVITRAAIDQVQIAVEAADLILFVLSIQDGILPLDEEVASRLRQSGKQVLLVLNKADTARDEAKVPEFSALGFEDAFPISAIHQRGIDPLMDTAVRALPAFAPPDPDAAPDASDDTPAPIKLAIVGRPNVGKSSIINALTRSERVIVTPIPGTTRDSVDVPFEVDTEGVRQSYVLIDTAGMRKSRRVHDSVEFFSVKRAEQSIARCDIAILVIDAEQGITEQDKKISDHIVQSHRACIVVINKWDLVSDAVKEARVKELTRRDSGKRQIKNSKVMTTLQEFGAWVQKQLFFLDYAPVIFTSAKSGFHLDHFLEGVRYVAAQLSQKISTGLLNRTLQDAVEQRQPISSKGHRLKFFYATQVKISPPTFVLFVNRSELFAEAYRKYLCGELRRAFGYEGCPIVLIPRARPKKVASIRRENTKRSRVAKTSGQIRRSRNKR